MASDRYHRLPIYQDHEPRRTFDLTRGRPGASVFDEMRRHMDDDWGSDPFSHTRTYRVRPFGAGMGLGLDDDLDSLCKDFFELKPRNPLLSSIKGAGGGSRESLDEDKVITPSDSQGQGRRFQMSFDVKDYEPQDISVKVDHDTLVVEAKRMEDRDGVKSTKQFSRNVHIPKDVDPDKLQSSLSKDGILTIEAPVPPKYQSVAYVGPQALSAKPETTATFQSQASYQPPSQPLGHPGYQPAPSIYAQAMPSQPIPSATAAYPAPASPAPAYQPATSGYPTSPPPTAAAAPSGGDTRSDQYDLPPPPAYPGYQSQVPPQPNRPAPAAPPPKSSTNNHAQKPPESSEPTPEGAASSQGQTECPVLDTPTFTDSPQGRRLDLMVELGKPYTPDDILVKLEGRQLVIEAEHVEKAGGKKSKSCMSREFDLEEDIDPRTVQANFDDSGRLMIVAMVLHKSEGKSEGDSTAQS